MLHITCALACRTTSDFFLSGECEVRWAGGGSNSSEPSSQWVWITIMSLVEVAQLVETRGRKQNLVVKSKTFVRKCEKFFVTTSVEKVVRVSLTSPAFSPSIHRPIDPPIDQSLRQTVYLKFLFQHRCIFLFFFFLLLFLTPAITTPDPSPTLTPTPLFLCPAGSHCCVLLVSSKPLSTGSSRPRELQS